MGIIAIMAEEDGECFKTILCYAIIFLCCNAILQSKVIVDISGYLICTFGVSFWHENRSTYKQLYNSTEIRAIFLVFCLECY